MRKPLRLILPRINCVIEADEDWMFISINRLDSVAFSLNGIVDNYFSAVDSCCDHGVKRKDVPGVI